MRIPARKIIGEAWEFTQSNKKLIIWYALIPSILTTLAGIIYLVYQYYSLVSSPLFENWNQSFLMLVASKAFQIVRDNFSVSLPIIIVIAVVGILYLLVPSFCEGAIIQLVARKRNGQDIRTRDGFRYGILSFLPLFEYSWLTRTFSPFSIFFWLLFLSRNLGWTALYTFWPIFFIFGIFGIILTVLFIYTEFFIVIDDRKVIDSVYRSSVLVMTHLEETILLSILMLIISVRILIQILFVLLIPALMLGIVYLIASATLPLIAFVIAGIVGLILLYIAAYISGTIHVFAASVWTFTFLELTSEMEVSARKRKNTEA
ncbi:hypothetical protein KJ951_01830 [Patescibacteria group bacterium]|nr:hypothetical protein [Patescibacteria group bacterium]MBU1703119.1 hypothetical protein [Patescibacteria group bacterium]MBU1953592.1 hypothetical protein [Patescibacteria group bacterium]